MGTYCSWVGGVNKILAREIKVSTKFTMCLIGQHSHVVRLLNGMICIIIAVREKTFRSWYGLIDSIWLCVCLRQTLSILSVFNIFAYCSWLLCGLRTISESSVNFSQLTAKVFCLLYLKFIVLLTTSFLIVINSTTMNGNLSWPIASVIFRLTKLLLKNVSGFKFRPSNWLKLILRTRYIF